MNADDGVLAQRDSQISETFYDHRRSTGWY